MHSRLVCNSNKTDSDKMLQIGEYLKATMFTIGSQERTVGVDELTPSRAFFVSPHALIIGCLKFIYIYNFKEQRIKSTDYYICVAWTLFGKHLALSEF